MKSKCRVVLLVAACLICSSYFYWPNSSYQNFLFKQIAPSVIHAVGPTSHLHEKCQTYFDIVRALAVSRPSNSRYLTKWQIANHIDHLKVYLKCHLDLHFNETRESAVLGAELLPMFSSHHPHMAGHNWAPFTESKGNYWSRYLGLSKGRGIVISLDDENTAFACRLLRVLHHLGNLLPIQFIHTGELSAGSIETLLLAAIGKQDVAFMDVSPVLKRGYSYVFCGYNNKWFATLFSTFEEIILMDVDVVPFISPETFFALDGYERTGAYFFRDRELSETLSKSQVEFFSTMFPTYDPLFNMVIDSAKLENNFFRFNSKHVMESGVVVLRRSSHLLGLLISLALQYWFQSGKIMYGDKDLFWLGQLISGNSEFHFNENAAAAIGVLEANNTICSTQLGHLNIERKLLWTNGALSVCKRDTWLFDYLRYPVLRQKSNYSMAGLRDSYRSPVKLKQAILPAPIKYFSKSNLTQITSPFAKDRSKGCGGIYYCASSDEGGEIVSFSQEEQARYETIVLVWHYPLNSTF